MSEQNTQPIDDDNDFLDLPDEELLNLDFSQFTVESQEDPADSAEAADEPTGEEGEAGAEDAPEEGQEDEQPEEEESADTEVSEEQSPEAEVETTPPEQAKPESVDYEAEYKKLFAPFRANGKEMQVKSAEDAIALMQMGANYNKKMAALKPNLKLLKLLENNGLLSEEKLSFLIDLDKKNPDAISKLVKDSGLDPLDMDVNKSEYKPNTYTVDDRELELDAVLEQIQDTPTYAQTIDIVSNKWDGPSKQVIAQHPQLLEVINDHLARGIYSLISAEVERERMFGRLKGLSDLEAYRTVGDAMNARGAFNQLAQAGGKVTPVADRRPVAPKPKAEDPAVRARKLAASPPKAAVPAKVSTDFNPLELSDEEFSKLGNPRLM